MQAASALHMRKWGALDDQAESNTSKDLKLKLWITVTNTDVGAHHLVLSPHFDDAVLSLGGLISSENGNCTIVTVFAGKPSRIACSPWDRLCGFLDSDQAYRARHDENAAALECLGVPANQRINWDFLDADYRPPSHEPEYTLLHSITAKLVSLLSSVTHDVCVYAPAYTLHLDHTLTKAALVNARRSVPKPEYFFYEDLPYPTYGIESPSGNALARTDLPLLPSDMDRKLKAIKRYKSQLIPLDRTFRMDTVEYVREFSRQKAAHAVGQAEYFETVYRIHPTVVGLVR